MSVEMEKDLVTNISNVTLENTTTMKDVVNFTDTYLTNTSIFTTHEENFSDFTYSSTLNNEDYLNISRSPQTLANRTYMILIKLINSNDLNKSTLFDTLTDVSIYRDSYNVSNPVFNTTLSTQWSEEYKRNLKFRLTFDATIELIMGSLFNTSTIPETKKQSKTDLTKNRCERIKLNNGIILVQDCEGDSRDVVNPVKKFSSPLHARKIFVKENDVILPGNRRFKRVSGIWHNGHCRCVQPLRSCSATLDVPQYLFLLVSFIYFVTI
ncbi:uncharacterized protein LOC108911798 [Anoplophora glabripennis]|uniref:uncharacterized protein LOC108911798 n=1 Tax=Anoplophora glabripennis TaxID=217634 RepID=UPI00087361CD|nr:uncharacterized protein LOC108911798 [Anoplophora glabripennis]